MLLIQRGRDPGVPQSAKARKRSEERVVRQRPHMAPRSESSSPSPAPSLSPRSPCSRSRSPAPLTLSDRVHIAYAADDIHLAKVLLLRLQGIEVTSDDDPRIAAVTDEDFDACFIPFGRLDDGLGGAPLDYALPVAKPTPTAIPDADARRTANLEAKERLWDTEARRYTEERVKLDAARRQQTVNTLEQDRIRMIKQKEAAAASLDIRRRRMHPTARTLNFALVPAVPQPPAKFTYDFPFTPRNRKHIAAPATPPPAPRQLAKPEPPRVEPREEIRPHTPNRVTFAQVLASMNGDLFPVLPGEQRSIPSRRREFALLEALLAAGVDVSPSSEKGKGKERSNAITICCADCSTSPASAASLSTPTTSSSGLSRAGSWLSFGSSRSSTSASTAASSWVSTPTPTSALDSAACANPPPSHRLSASMSTWIPGARRTTSPSPVPSRTPSLYNHNREPAVHGSHCRCRDSARIPALTAHPLYVAPPSLPTSFASTHPPHQDNNGLGALKAGLGKLGALARNMQQAYVKAMVVGYGGVSGEWDEQEHDSASDEEDLGYGYVEKQRTKERERVVRTPPPGPPPRPSTLRLKPVGARAGCADVKRFVGGSSAPAQSSSASSSSTTNPTSTTLDSDTDDEPLVPSAHLSPLPPTLRSKSRARALSQSSLPTYVLGPSPSPLPLSLSLPRTQLPSRLPYERVFVPPVPPPRSPWLVVLTMPPPGPSPTPSPTSPSSPLSTSEVEPEEAMDEETDAGWRSSPIVRRRSVTNSAFLRVKALHNAGDALGVGLSVAAAPNSSRRRGGRGGGSALNTPMPAPTTGPTMPTPRWPKEAISVPGVDCVPGSGLRFVYAREVAV